MNEAPDVVYGRLLESAHLSGYSFERACDELMWLLEGDRWQSIGPGYQDVNDFLRSIDLSSFNLGDNRPKLHKRIKELQPEASVRAIAKATGTPKSAVHRDIVPDGTSADVGIGDSGPASVPDGTIAPLTGREAAARAREAALRRHKEAERERQRAANAELVAGNPIERDLANDANRYTTITIDPPWDHADQGDHDVLGRGRPRYAVMPLGKLLGLPVGEKATDNAHLYLWVTNRSLRDGFLLVDEWGFRFVTVLTWIKPSFGMGNYFRGSTEHVLFAIRGSLALLRADAPTHFAADRPERHSEKPTVFYELVESCSPGPWLELFSRNRRPGWAAYGAEVAA